MTRRLEPDLDSRWEYDTATQGTGELAETFTWAGNTKDYRRVHSYDALGRPSTTVTSLDADYASTVTYDAFGRPDRTTHSRSARGAGATGAVAASNTFQQHYNSIGYADRIDRYEGANTAAITLWTAQAMDAEGRLTQEQLGNGAVTRRGYNPYTGRLNSIRSGVSAADAQFQNDSYDYDVLGNLESRSQLMSNGGAALNESFTYDALNRLNTSTIGGVTKTTTYDELGNLTSKTGVGLYRYPPSGAGSTAPNAVASVLGTVAGLANPGFSYEVNGNLKTGMGRRYAWTAYDMPSSIDKLDGTNAVQRTAFLYGPDHARTRQTISPVSGEVAGSPTTTIWYGGAIEKEIDTAANTTTIRTVLPAQLGFIEEKFSGTATAATADGTRNLRYFLTDHLGSTLVEMDQAQAVLQRMSYDAWGRRRNADGSDDTGPQWGSLKNAQDHSGYTGHEHLDQLGLVNMNARMYDPLLGRHTSADPTVPDPANAQAFNRYSYVLNNALVFTDPTGLSAFGRSDDWRVLIDNPTIGGSDKTRPNAYLRQAIEAAGGAEKLAGLVSQGLFPAMENTPAMTGNVTQIMNQAAADEAEARTVCSGACQIPGSTSTAQQPAAPQGVRGWIADNILEPMAQATEPLTGLPGVAAVPGVLKATMAIIRVEKVVVEAGSALKAEALASKGAAEGEKLLFRRGPMDTKKLLESQAQAAENVLGVHGVSVSTSSAAKAGQVVRCATCSSVEAAGFKVQQTGKDLNHHTVELPKPITPDVVRIWNELFK
ncbi:RHS repeat-associated core domain-containing protein, partial [Rhizobacter sp. SG703]|uniref:RHS repeat domain-containing protein n=1 Tax=Rhizobacter sp. SG703 TaxID=2587140 RepID=UPI0014459362